MALKTRSALNLLVFVWIKEILVKVQNLKTSFPIRRSSKKKLNPSYRPIVFVVTTPLMLTVTVLFVQLPSPKSMMTVSVL